MKHLLFAVFENNKYTHDVICALTNNNINGTVIASTSLKHFLSDLEENEIQFMTLRHLEKYSHEENTTFYTLLDEEEIDIATQLIKETTDSFSKVKGGLFVLPIERYEGSF